jgi:hypothetical protein
MYAMLRLRLSDTDYAYRCCCCLLLSINDVYSSQATAAVSGSSSDDTDTTVVADSGDKTNESTHIAAAAAAAAVENECYFELGQHVLDLFEPLAVTESEFMRADVDVSSTLCT